MSAVPYRIGRAVELLDPSPVGRVLEIGGGGGAAARLVLDRLDDRGRFVLVDRSETAVARAVASLGEDHRFATMTSEIADVELEPGSFDKVFAVNVNVFWTGDAANEIEVVGRVLRPDGLLVLVYETPTANRLDMIGDRLTSNLSRGAFEPKVRVEGDRNLVSIVATLATSA